MNEDRRSVFLELTRICSLDHHAPCDYVDKYMVDWSEG